MTRLIALLCALSLFSCELAEELLQGLRTGQRSLSDDDAFKHLRKDRTDAPETDVSSVMKVIDGEVTGEPDMEDPGVQSLLKRVVHARNNIDESAFDLVDFEAFGLRDGPPGEKKACSGYEVVDSEIMYDDYLIPKVEKIPVRNQGRRGTCAAFAAIGSLEYTVLNPVDGEGGHASLPTFDLSEQRFYWMSKNDCQGPSGCECPGCQEGSWYGRGFDASQGAGGLDIPLETDCPYNNKPGANDTQYPQKGSCDTGAVRVKEVEYWCGVDELVDLLHRGYAVPYASPLSSNWEANDGLVTKADLEAQGNTVHAGGHAYLIVGYKKLPDMQDEGGVCFYVKNSWGTGWGVNGYACQTLAWMAAVNFEGFIGQQQPIALDLEVREDLVGTDELPDDNEEAEEEEADDIPEEEEPDPEDEDVLPPPEPDPKPEPAPEPEPETYEDAKLLGPSETYYRVDVSERDGHLSVRGLLLAGKGTSKPLQVKKSGKKLSYKGDVVGSFDGSILKLCTDEWAALCSIRFRKSDKQAYIQFRNDDLRKVQGMEHSADKGEWLNLNLGGRDYGVFIPTDLTSVDFLFNPKTFIRLGGSEPARLSLRKLPNTVNFEIFLGGQNVGRLVGTDPISSSLCSGDFANSCRVVGGNRAFVLPRNKGSRKAR